MDVTLLDTRALSAEPPKSFVLFKSGWTDTKKGKFLFDSQAAEMVLAYAAEDGRDKIPFDAGHGMLSGNDPDRHKALGWFELGVVDGDLIAENIEWTPAARLAIMTTGRVIGEGQLLADRC